MDEVRNAFIEASSSRDNGPSMFGMGMDCLTEERALEFRLAVKKSLIAMDQKLDLILSHLAKTDNEEI